MNSQRYRLFLVSLLSPALIQHWLFSIKILIWSLSISIACPEHDKSAQLVPCRKCRNHSWEFVYLEHVLSIFLSISLFIHLILLICICFAIILEIAFSICSIYLIYLILIKYIKVALFHQIQISCEIVQRRISNLLFSFEKFTQEAIVIISTWRNVSKWLKSWRVTYHGSK